MVNAFLTFSDAAKYADVARNILRIGTYGSNFQFWSNSTPEFVASGLFSAKWIQPVTPYSIAFLFRIFGIHDWVVVLTSLFYFILTLIFVYLLSREIFKNRLVSVITVLTVAFNQNMIDYATSGASEMPFTFGIVASAYFLSFSNFRKNIIGFLFLVFIYFTRPHAIIYILGLLIYFLLNILKFKQALLSSFILIASGLILYSFTSKQGYIAAINYLPGSPTSDLLRGTTEIASFEILAKKTLYNLYNFYKLMPQILNPYIWCFFILGIFRRSRNKIINNFKIISLIILITNLIAVAITIPLFRYIHPIIPFVYVVAADTLVWFVKKTIDEWDLGGVRSLNRKLFNLKFLSKDRAVVFVSFFVLLYLAVGQTIGTYVLDSRYENRAKNMDKQPIYVTLALKLKENTKTGELIITNLDTWGSWYGERKTVWFPLEPDQLIPAKGEENPFDAIYLTSYLIDDENYYMGSQWRQIFENPQNIQNDFIRENYVFAGEYKLSADEVYEKYDARAILLVKKQ